MADSVPLRGRNAIAAHHGNNLKNQEQRVSAMRPGDKLVPAMSQDRRWTRARWWWWCGCALWLGVLGCYESHPQSGGAGSSPAPEVASAQHPDRPVVDGDARTERPRTSDPPPTQPGDGTLPPTQPEDDGEHEPFRDAGAPAAPRSPDPEPLLDGNVRIAFIGDQGIGATATELLKRIRSEGAQLVVHAGDLSYGDGTPAEWIAQIDSVLGADFPYLVAAGNHDLDEWGGEAGFAAVLTARRQRTPELRCEGELGIAETCRFHGIDMVVSGVGTVGEGHEAFLDRALHRSSRRPQLCVWHKNQHDLQAGAKADEVGWEAYQICAHHGAAIINAHEHSYARTLTLTAIGDRDRGHGAGGDPTRVRVAEDSTFVAVSGLGGRSFRALAPDHALDVWWASIYAGGYQLLNGVQTGQDEVIEPGALFIDFVAPIGRGLAHAYFKTASGVVADRFDIVFER